jgi:hypothetical protein
MKTNFTHHKISTTQDFMEILYGNEPVVIEEELVILPIFGYITMDNPGVVVGNGIGKEPIPYWELVKAYPGKPVFFTNLLGEKCMVTVHANELMVTRRMKQCRRKSTHHPVYNNRQIGAMMR